MKRNLVLGTAGHIDHGKTRLVAALTGIDTDRLPEEKQRGITIDLGFAHLDLGDVRLNLIDVPGHERFIRNMLAGSSAIDLAMLVVAADESVMPQTREHLNILDLLGVKHGVVAITKTDLADGDMLELVTLETQELLEASGLENVPIVPVSAATGQGLDELKEAIIATATQIAPADPGPYFRLNIDRRFTSHGHGSVVTGTVNAGRAAVGNSLDLLPRGESVTIRQLQQHGQEAEQIAKGQRAAINLARVPLDALERGQVLASPGTLMPSRWLAVQLATLPDAPLPIRHRTDYRLHIGTDEVIVNVRLLAGTTLKPGASTQAILSCAQPVSTLGADAFVLRALSPIVTLGGGTVLLPNARPIRRRDADNIERLAQLSQQDLPQRIAAAVALHGVAGCSLRELWRCLPIDEQTLQQACDDLINLKTLVPFGEATSRYIHRAVFDDARVIVLKAMKRLHKAHPLEPTIPTARLAAAIRHRLPRPALEDLLEILCSKGVLKGDKAAVALPNSGPTLNQTQQEQLAACIRTITQAGLQPPRISELATSLGLREKQLQMLIDYAVASGQLVRLDGTYCLSRAANDQLLTQLKQTIGPDGVTISDIRQVLAITRKHATPICEYLDRIGFTTRRGDLRFLAQP